MITRLLGAYDDLAASVTNVTPGASVYHGGQNAESETFCDTTTNVVDALANPGRPGRMSYGPRWARPAC